MGDVRDVVEKAKLLLLTKNEGNLFQDFLYQCNGVTGGTATKPGAPVDKETAKQHGNEALEGFRTLGQLLITNGQFRKLRKSSHPVFAVLADGLQSTTRSSSSAILLAMVLSTLQEDSIPPKISSIRLTSLPTIILGTKAPISLCRSSRVKHDQPMTRPDQVRKTLPTRLRMLVRVMAMIRMLPRLALLKVPRT